MFLLSDAIENIFMVLTNTWNIVHIFGYLFIASLSSLLYKLYDSGDLECLSHCSTPNPYNSPCS